MWLGGGFGVANVYGGAKSGKAGGIAIVNQKVAGSSQARRPSRGCRNAGPLFFLLLMRIPFETTISRTACTLGTQASRLPLRNTQCGKKRVFNVKTL